MKETQDNVTTSTDLRPAFVAGPEWLTLTHRLSVTPALTPVLCWQSCGIAGVRRAEPAAVRTYLLPSACCSHVAPNVIISSLHS